MKIGSQTVVVVTGAANGIGRALAAELARRGATLALIDIDRTALTGAPPPPTACSTHVCDITDADAVSAVAKAVVGAHGAVHLLVNNAGVSVTGSVEDLALADFQRAMAVNFWGGVHACRAFLPHLRAAADRSEEAAICNVLSEFSFFSLPNKAAYAASKHAARAFTEALDAELYGTGISVTAVYPGATATGLLLHGSAVDEMKRGREAAVLAHGMRPETVARKIVEGLERGNTRVLIGLDTRLIAAATRLVPGLFQAGVRRFWRRVPFL